MHQADLAFPLIDAAGSPFERGRDYGRGAAERIAVSVAIYEEPLARQGLPWSTVRAIAGRYLPRLEAFSADLTEEIRGIAAGCERPVEDIVALNARTELLYDKALREGLDSLPPDGCTGAIAMPGTTADGHMLHGQNWDWLDACKHSAVVVRMTYPDGMRLLTFVEAGILARAGMNSHGIAVTGNFLNTPSRPAEGAVPIPLVRRRVLESATLFGAVGEVLNSPRSFCNNMMISDAAGEAVDLETTPEEAFWELPEQGLLVHSNHFRTQAARARVKDTGLMASPDSIYRDRRVEAHLRQRAGQVTQGDLQAAFADTYGAPRGVCRSPTPETNERAPTSTVASLIMDTTAGHMWLARAPYDQPARYSRYDLHG